MNAADLTQEELTGALVRTHNVIHTARAALQLVLDQGYWLQRLEFRDAVDVELVCGLAYAWVDWAKAAPLADQVQAPDREMAVLRLACLLAGKGPGGADGWSIPAVLADIDPGDTALAITAFASAATGGRI